MLDRSEVGKRGYLNEDFRLFHLKDSRAQKLEYHYHEFDKLILLLGGKVTPPILTSVWSSGWATIGSASAATPARRWTPASTLPASGASTCCALERSSGCST